MELSPKGQSVGVHKALSTCLRSTWEYLASKTQLGISPGLQSSVDR